MEEAHTSGAELGTFPAIPLCMNEHNIDEYTMKFSTETVRKVSTTRRVYEDCLWLAARGYLNGFRDFVKFQKNMTSDEVILSTTSFDRSEWQTLELDEAWLTCASPALRVMINFLYGSNE